MATLLEQIANIQTLIDNLEALAFGDENTSATHNGQTRDSLSKAIAGKFDALQAMVQGRLTYETKAAMDAAGAPPAGELAEVVNDPVTENNRLYFWDGAAWAASKYDPMGYVDESLVGIEKKPTMKFPSMSDANGIELLGFDNNGRVIFTASPRVVNEIRNNLSDDLLQKTDADYPQLMDADRTELLGFDGEGRARFAVSQDVADQVKKLIGYNPAAEYDPVASGLLPSSDILMLGDSMTNGTISSKVASILGRSVSVLQKGGMDAYSIAVIMGVIPLTVTISGNEIPASGGVAVTTKSTNILFTGGIYTGTANVTIGGVPGVLSTDSAGVWTFTRDTAGVAVSVSEGVTAILNPDVGTSFIPATNAYINRTVVIRLGRNGTRTTRTDRVNRTLEPLRLIAEKFTPLCRRLVFITVYNKTSEYEPSGSADYDLIMSLNEEIIREFGPYVLDMRSAAVKNAIYDIGDTPTQADLDDMSADCIPTRYFNDTTHVNSTMHNWEGEFIANYLRTIGY